MWVKICANTNLEDALAAVEAGADAVGFVFAPSVRQVTAAQVAAITPHLPPHVERVGVFAGEGLEEIAAAVQQAGLTAVQMHGGVNLELAHRFEQRLGGGIAIIQTAHWSVAPEAAQQAQDEARVSAQLQAVADDPAGYRMLVDAKVGRSSGGLGVAFDWERARPVLTAQPGLRLIVAGGLNPENVAGAIQVLRPYGVDVASGVERGPGMKSEAKMKAFVKAARGA